MLKNILLILFFLSNSVNLLAETTETIAFSHQMIDGLIRLSQGEDDQITPGMSRQGAVEQFKKQNNEFQAVLRILEPYINSENKIIQRIAEHLYMALNGLYESNQEYIQLILEEIPKEEALEKLGRLKEKNKAIWQGMHKSLSDILLLWMNIPIDKENQKGEIKFILSEGERQNLLEKINTHFAVKFQRLQEYRRRLANKESANPYHHTYLILMAEQIQRALSAQRFEEL